MTSLPPALAAWAEPLSLFPPELALSLGPCVSRLAQALGPLAHPAEEISDDPNGYEGLSRRGSYERLLISEWLLADEVPEEFLRRAAQREHAFLALSFRKPGGSRSSLALFDAGPELIGEPRIGQLAALVVLSERARRAGVVFAWGVLQDEERRVCREITPLSILQLLLSRTARTASADDAAAWTAIDGKPLAADDLWVIGSPRTIAAGGPAASRLEFEDPLLPGRRELVATVRRKALAPRPLELPLPERAECVRLLRDPFSALKAPAPAPSPRTPASPANGIAFSQNGRRILVRHRDGSVSAHPVPNSPRMPAGLPQVFELKERETLVAAGWMRGAGARVMLVQNELGFCLHGLQRRSTPPIYWRDGAPRVTASTPPAPLSTLLHVPGAAVGESPSGYVHVFLDAEGQLFKLGGGPDRMIELVASDVLACAERGGELHVIRGMTTYPGAAYLIAHTVDGKDVSLIAGMPGLRAFFGCGWPWIGIEREVGRWEVIGGGPNPRRYSLAAPTGTEVFGVAATAKTRGIPGLLLVEPDRRSTSLIGLGGKLAFPQTRSPIVFAVANPVGPEIATLEMDGTVTVVSLIHERKVLELRPPTASVQAPASLPPALVEQLIAFTRARAAGKERE